MARMLITGHKGFIGGNLVEHLSDKYDIVGIDIKDGWDRDGLNNNQDLLTCKLPDPSSIDIVIHLAGIGGVRESLKDPAKYWNNNVEVTKRILEHFKYQRVLVASSSSGYEPHLNPYAASKRTIESIPHINVCYMRFHTVYGPTPRANMFFDKLLNDKLEYVTTHERDFIHIEDLCDAIEILLNNDVKGPIDIGTGQSVKVQDLRPDLPVRLNTVGERRRTKANIEKLKELGFEPKYTVDRFLKERGIQ